MNGRKQFWVVLGLYLLLLTGALAGVAWEAARHLPELDEAVFAWMQTYLAMLGLVLFLLIGA
ncbi:MAG: hypothetical protein HQM00_16920, partial [Magnetococcales bacterium]|nr:hypothetical protein [Magnetococcales bacterium]